MGRELLHQYLKSRAADTPAETPETPEKKTGFQPKPAWIKACTPETPETSINTNSRELFQTRPSGEAVNDPAGAELPSLAQPPAPYKPDKGLKFLDWADGWIELDKAYQRHHWGCPQCKAAGRGAGYGLRCGVGAALYRAYEDAAGDRSALDW